MPPDEYNGRDLLTAELALKRRYEEQRRKSQPSFSCNPKNDGHFQKAAEKVVALKIAPMAWIDAQFANWGNNGFPQPANLYCEAAVKRYESFAATDRCPPEMEFEGQRIYLKNYVKRAKLKRDEALSLPWTQFRAYFRVLFCGEVVLPHVMKMFGTVAQEQVNGDTLLRNFLQKRCPEQLERLIPPKEEDLDFPEDDELLPLPTPIEDSCESEIGKGVKCH